MRCGEDDRQVRRRRGASQDGRHRQDVHGDAERDHRSRCSPACGMIKVRLTAEIREALERQAGPTRTRSNDGHRLRRLTRRINLDGPGAVRRREEQMSSRVRTLVQTLIDQGRYAGRRNALNQAGLSGDGRGDGPSAADGRTGSALAVRQRRLRWKRDASGPVTAGMHRGR